MSNCSSFSLPLMYLNFTVRCRLRHIPTTSAVRRRHHRRRLLKYSPNHSPTPPSTIFKLSDDTLHITLKPPSNSLQQIETKLNQFIEFSREAFDDLRTVVTVDLDSGGVVFSCRRSTVEFFVALFLSSLVVIVAFRGLFKLKKSGGQALIYKRDRSLGGREVIVGKKEANWSSSRNLTPLSADTATSFYHKQRSRTRLRDRRRKEELPQWWPQAVQSAPTETTNKEEYQRIANQFVRALMDRKMHGEDISTNDIVQLRHMCKTYGVRALIETTNARDSLFRASTNFVLSYCERISDLSTSIQINGEDVREFIAGLADNIGLDSTHAARIASAAVAARTRSRILQAWALEVQNKHSEALGELLKVCVIHRIFPPEESSPEMEMVAQGLEKSLSVEQREHILNSFITVCGKDVDQSVAEALGLEGFKDEK